MDHCHKHNTHERPPLVELTGKLRQGSRRLTGARQAILEILRRQKHPMAAKELFAALPAGDCDLATVYRSLNLLESMGMLKRFDLGGGVARFELLAEGDDGHHHHLVCTECGSVVELPDCSNSMSEMETAIAGKHGYRGVTHKLEFFGVCTACQRQS